MTFAVSASNTAAFSGANVVPIGKSPTRLVVMEPDTDWWTAARDRLNELVALPDGWDGYAGKPTSFINASFALRMLEAVCSTETKAPQIVPGSGGDLQIEWHLPAGSLELHVHGPNNVTAWYCDGETGEDGIDLDLTNNFIVVSRWLEALEEAGAAGADAAAA